MVDGELSEQVQRFLRQHVPSMDHCAILLALRSAAPGLSIQELSSLIRIDERAIAVALKPLVTARLVEQQGERYRYEPALGDIPCMDELASMYTTRPVTLVRAIYGRTSAADAVAPDNSRKEQAPA